MKQKYRSILAFLLLAGAGAAAFAVFAVPSAEAPSQADAVESVVAAERDGFRYEFHVPTGRESLFSVKDDPKRLVNLIDRNRDVASKCRADIEKRLGEGGLSALRAQYEAQIRRMHALGYL